VAFIEMLNKNSRAALITIAGPVGISHIKEAIIPKIIVMQPNMLPKMAIWVGLLAQILAMALGIINNAFINNTPTNRIVTAKIRETKMVKTHLILVSLIPSVMANSL
jgi:hypothetical protein